MDRTTPPRRRIRTAVIAGSSALALVVGGGSWWALDRFVIPHVEIASATAYEAENSTVESVSTEDSNAVATATSYDSDYADITISTVTTGSGDDTVTYYVADVVLGDATALRSAFAEDTFGENITETTSEIAAANDAIFAINGDYYGFRDTGIVIRNGVIYRDEGARDGLAFFLDGWVSLLPRFLTPPWLRVCFASACWFAFSCRLSCAFLLLSGCSRAIGSMQLS